MNKIVITISSIFLFILFNFSCVHKPETTPLPSAEIPQNLKYASGILHVTNGSNATSVQPTIIGTSPITYSLTTSPSSNGSISINNNGVISVDNAAPAGTYQVSIVATNAAGSVTFTNVFEVIVDAKTVAPSSLVYVYDTLTIEQGSQSILSSAPVVSGSAPMKYGISSSSNLITINDSTGIIQVNAGLPIGTYPLDITATNVAGSKTFVKALVIAIVVQGSPSLFNYTPNALTVVDDISANSTAPSIVGTGGLTYTLTSTPANTGISINNSTGIISVSSSPIGVYDVIVTATNTLGSASTKYSISVQPSFSMDIAPIMISHCTSCHNGIIKNTNFNSYSEVQTYISAIQLRIQLPVTYSQFMPYGGQPLSSSEIDVIKKWASTGMAQ